MASQGFPKTSNQLHSRMSAIPTSYGRIPGETQGHDRKAGAVPIPGDTARIQEDKRTTECNDESSAQACLLRERSMKRVSPWRWQQRVDRNAYSHACGSKPFAPATYLTVENKQILSHGRSREVLSGRNSSIPYCNNCDDSIMQRASMKHKDSTLLRCDALHV